MQIQSTSITSALVQYRSTGTTGEDTVNGINPTSAATRDKQSDDRKQSTQQQAIVNATNKVQTIPNLHSQRVSAARHVSNDALASSTHSAKQAVQTFQQIDLMSEPEIMHRIDAQA